MRGVTGLRRHGFTLVELLVVIGIIALLMGIFMPVLSRARRTAMVTQCAANLHDVGLAMLNYAASSHGQLPQFDAHPTSGNPNPGGGYWLWDVEAGYRDALVQNGAHRKNLYCPLQQNQDADVHWDWNVTKNPDGSLSGYSVLGYYLLTLRPDATYPNVTPTLYDKPLNDPKFTIPTWRYQKTVRPDNRGCSPAKANVSTITELATDATGDDGKGNFGNMTGGTTSNSAHWFGGLPVGGNVLYMDGHVSNRAFTKRSVPGPNQDVRNPDIMHWRCNPQNNATVRFFF